MVIPMLSRFIAALATLLLAPIILLAGEAPRKKPNVIVIIADDLGYADLGCAGGKKIKTPNLDRIAKEGVRATSFYVTWPACTPSRSSVLTGRCPQRNGLYDMVRNDLVNFGHRFTMEEYLVSPEMTLGLDVREKTLGDLLRGAGYRTAVVGKWDMGQARRFLPLQRGFDSFYGFGNNGIDYYTHERYGIPSLFRGNERVKEEGYATDLFRREALQFIKQNKDHPFFLYLGFNAPHSASHFDKNPYQVPAKYVSAYAGEDPKANRTKYMAMVTCMDEAIGEILNLLQSSGLTEDTLILFFSDNGGTRVSDNGPLRGIKTQMFEGGVRVPMLARWPGRIPAGQVTDEFLTTLELFPTLAAVSGATLPRGVILDGHDMMPVLQGTTKSPRTAMFWQRRSDKAARVSNYKWVESAQGNGLFDLSRDIGEQNDLSKSHPQEFERLRNRWQAWRLEMDKAEPRGPFRDY
jgi:arylsulfatase A-like enzyme